MTRPSQLKDVKDPKHPRWAEFYKKYRVYLSYIARGKGLPEDKVEDLVATVMSELSTRVMPKFDYDPAEGTFRSYLAAIIGNKLKSQIRAAMVRPKLVRPPENTDSNGTAFIDQQPDPVLKPAAEKALADLAKAIVATAMRILRGPEHKFSETQLQAFEMYVTKEMAVDDICEELSMTAQRVYNAKTRIMPAFKAACQQAMNDLAPGDAAFHK